MNLLTTLFTEHKKLLGTILVLVNIVAAFFCAWLWENTENASQILIIAAILVTVDIGYALLHYRVQRSFPNEKTSQKGVYLQQDNVLFPANPRFEALWSNNQEYLEVGGLRLRIARKKDWSFAVGEFQYKAFVIEGAITYTESRGDISAEFFERMMEIAEEIKQEMGWHELFTINNSLHSGKVDKHAARRTRQVLAEKWERGVRENVYLIANDFIRISFAITRKALPHAYSQWRVFSSFGDAVLAMIRDNFSKNSPRPFAQMSSRLTQVSFSGKRDFHQERIDQMYTVLARIESSDVDDIPIPKIPADDMYADIFKALEMVLEDKRSQLQKAHRQTLELERQSAEIQLANTKLLEQNRELERQSAEIQLANGKLEEQNRELEEQAVAIQLANGRLSEQNVELNALNNEKNELMGIVSHDLKNPISAVRTFADMILEGYVKPENISSVAKKILVTTDRMLELVTNLLDLNRLEQGAAQLKMVSAPLYSILDSMMFQYQENAAPKSIVLSLEQIGKDCEVIFDEQAITQVLDNLISNAIKFSPFEKKIMLRLRSMPSSVRIEIQDEGPGISEEDMKKLFGKFARLSAQPTAGEHSTGLGLSIVKKLVEAMQGKIWCESELGRGATFIVEFPIANALSAEG